MATVKIDNSEFEAGGAILHPKNMYMQKFVKLLGKYKYSNYLLCYSPFFKINPQGLILSMLLTNFWIYRFRTQIFRWPGEVWCLEWR